jgi:pimeloyl-ACP methyl ester carboxylesterase
MSKLPSIVFVHGMFHVPANYDVLLKLLKDAGYRVSAPQLPSMQDLTPAVGTMEPDIKAVREAIEQELEQDHDVVLVMHSYGGVVGSQAFKGLAKKDRGDKSGVTQLVGVAANLLDEGEKMADFNLVEEELAKAAMERAMKRADGYIDITLEEVDSEPSTTTEKSANHNS